MLPSHELSTSQLAALATGGGGPAVIGELRRAQLSKHLLLIRYVVRQWPGDPAARERAVAVLAAAQERDAAAVADLLSAPMTGAWTSCAARRMPRAADASRAAEDNCGYLGALAVVAAARAGIDADLPVPAPGGRVHLPTMGTVLVPEAGRGPTTARVRDRAVTLSAAGERVRVPVRPPAAGPNWLPLRRLRAGARIDLALDDLDPYRGGHHIEPADRLPDIPFNVWRDAFAAAGDLLDLYAPDRAAELAAGLRAVVPLQELDDGSARSATLSDVFGAFGLTLPESPAELAVTMVHEFQHSKLSAVLDLAPLVEPRAPGRFYAPWRTDPRPLGGLLQGVYAFIAVADTWHRLRAAPGVGDAAEQAFADVREQVHHAVGTLRAAPGLTAAGRRFAAGLGEQADRLLAEPVPRAVADRARAALAANLTGWRRRNVPVAAG